MFKTKDDVFLYWSESRKLMWFFMMLLNKLKVIKQSEVNTILMKVADRGLHNDDKLFPSMIHDEVTKIWKN